MTQHGIVAVGETTVIAQAENRKPVAAGKHVAVLFVVLLFTVFTVKMYGQKVGPALRKESSKVLDIMAVASIKLLFDGFMMDEMRGAVTVEMIARMATTIIISISVNPASSRCR